MAGEVELVEFGRAETPPGVLTRDQRVVADRLCQQARTLDLRVRALAKAVWSGQTSRADGAAVYGWLVELDLADRDDSAVGLGGAA
jgi:hypothetical protein